MFKSKRLIRIAAALLFLVVVFGATALFASDAADVAKNALPLTEESSMPWWGWPLILFVVTFILGILAVLGGVGGGVLFVPIIGGFFPFHLDFVRGAGLLVALAGALAAGPGLLKRGLADLRLAIPVALIASSFAIVGAMIGLALPTNVVQTALGATILGIVAIMLMAKKSEYPEVKQADALSTALRINGIYTEVSTGEEINWQIHRTVKGLLLFIIVGVMAGMFGLGAGWANVPVLNLLMGAPLKISVATSKFLLSITDTSAAWVYINNGAVLPMIVAPSIVGIMLGSIVGVKILVKTKPAAVKYIVIVMLLFAGARAFLKGLGIWT
ncbi:MAG: sulfite exporter TauE/SafE family protein [Thermodesulfovibrionales bacterium]|nr:sulfite exporter TauE/SafE family protein [Thermodesulfovibrionales bacterium]